MVIEIMNFTSTEKRHFCSKSPNNVSSPTNPNIRWRRADIWFLFSVLFFYCYYYYYYYYYFIFHFFYLFSFIFFLVFLFLSFFFFNFLMLSFFRQFFLISFCFFEEKTNGNCVADGWHRVYSKRWWPRAYIGMRINSILNYTKRKITYFTCVTWKIMINASIIFDQKTWHQSCPCYYPLPPFGFFNLWRRGWNTAFLLL